MTGFLAFFFFFARGEACQASSLRGLSPAPFGRWELSLDASLNRAGAFFFFLGGGDQAMELPSLPWSSAPHVPPECTDFFFSHTPSQVVELPSLHESFWVD